MMKKIIWAILFAAGLFMILGCVTLSRFWFTEGYAWVIAGGMLCLLSGSGLLLELYQGSKKR